MSSEPLFPEGSLHPVDVYKDGSPAAMMWRQGEQVTFRYRPDSEGIPPQARGFARIPRKVCRKWPSHAAVLYRPPHRII